MDEPFGALDPLTRDALGAAYRALHERLGLTTVMVTHDMPEAVLLADRIVVLKARPRPGRRHAARAAGRRRRPGGARPCMAMPRRQAERIGAIMACDGRRHGARPAMNERIASASQLLPDYLAWHVLLSAVALALGVLLSLPLAVLRGAQPAPALAGRWRSPSLIQTIPSLALLALFYPLLLALSALTAATVRLGLPGARLPAVAAGADALFDAADPAERRRRPDRRRPGRARGGRRRRHDTAPAAVAGRSCRWPRR